MSAVFDWIGSLNIHPEFFSLCATQVDSLRYPKVSISESVIAYHGCVLRMNPDGKPDLEDPEVHIKGFGTITQENHDETLPLDDTPYLILLAEEKPLVQVFEDSRYV